MNQLLNFFKPSDKIQNTFDQQRAEVLIWFLFIRNFIFLTIIFDLFQSGYTHVIAPVSFALLINIIALIISKSKYYSLGAIIVVIEGILVIPQTILMNSQDPPYAALWLGLGIIVSGIVLPLRFTLLTLAFTFLDYLYLKYNIHTEHLSILNEVFIYLLFSSLLVIIASYLLARSNQLLESERAKVIHMSKLSTLSEIASGVAHEINTPLAAIILQAEMLKRWNSKQENPIAEIDKRCLSITETGHRIGKIIQGFKGFSRNQNDELNETFSLQELLDYSLDLCHEKFKNHGVQINIGSYDKSLTLKGSKVKLSQVILNLLNNAHDAIEKLETKWINIDFESDNKFLTISITDAGNGLSKDVQQKIFQPFFTTKGFNKGTGLGLSISKSILNEHQGDLIYNENATHTQFLLKFPFNNIANKVG